MILAADSGSTKTAWILADGEGNRKGFATSGLNPCLLPPDKIRATLASELPPQAVTGVSEVRFYGSGCIPAKIPVMTAILSELFPGARVGVESDLLGACRGLCGHGAGIVCILGTGSNSCEYDGERIVANTPPLGYILGDEGSGAALGRAFVSDCLKGRLSAGLKEKFLETFGLTQDDIIENVYRRPMANRFLAGFAPFVCEHRHMPEIHSLATGAFRSFLERNVLGYGCEGKKINFTGSVAFHFGDLLAEAVEAAGLEMGITVRSPIAGIASYHAG